MASHTHAPRVRAARVARLTLALVSLSSGCDPRLFDELAQRGDAAPGSDAGSTELPEDAARPDGGLDAARPDASQLDGRAAEEQTADASSVRGDAANDAQVSPADAGDPCVRSDGRALVSAPAVELARMAKSPTFLLRSLGPSMRLGERDHVWTFSYAVRASTATPPGPSAQNHPYIAFDGVVQPWKTPVAAGSSWTLREPAVAPSVPPTVHPLIVGEPAQLTLVPTSLVRLADETRGQLYTVQYDAFTATKVWLSTLDDGATVALRHAQPLFSAPPLFAYGARLDGDYVILYACEPGTPTRCTVGRAPITMLGQASAYEVRALDTNGKWFWSNDLKAGVPVLEDVNFDLTVSYNAYLRRFLAVYGEPKRDHVVLRTATAPWGPWSEPTRVPLPKPAALSNSNMHEHAALAQNCERRIVISYFAATSADSFFIPTSGDTVLTAIDLD